MKEQDTLEIPNESPKWLVDNVIPAKIIEQILLFGDDLNELPDIMVSSSECFGIHISYKREVIVTNLDDNFHHQVFHDFISEYRYTLCTNEWSLEFVVNPAKLPVRKEDFVWEGRGDFARWERDAVLLMMSLA